MRDVDQDEVIARLWGDLADFDVARTTDACRHLMAELAGLAPSTVHQYAVNLYRKFGVNGRAGLMSLWLNHAC